MALTRTITGVSDDTQLPFDDGETNSSISNNNGSRSITQVAGDVSDTLSQEVQDKVQGYIGYVTDFYNPNSINPSQEVEADTWTNLEPALYILEDHRPDTMKEVATDGYLMQSHQEHGHESHGANHFTLAGLESGSFGFVRILFNLTPEVDESSAQVRLHFNTNSATSASGLTEFTTEAQALVMTQGAELSYSDEQLITFFVGDTLGGLDLETAGSFHIQVKSSVEAQLEVQGVTFYINR